MSQLAFKTRDKEIITNISSQSGKRSVLEQYHAHILAGFGRLGLGADLSDPVEFHDLLSGLNRLTDASLVESYIEMQHPEYATVPKRNERYALSQESKVSRWINRKATPRTLKTRQQIIDAGYICLIYSLQELDPQLADELADEYAASKRPPATVIPFSKASNS